MNAAAKVRLLHELLSDENRNVEGPVMTCPVPTMLSALVEGGLDGDAGQHIREHLRNCDACAELYERVIAFARPETVLDPPVKSSEAAAWEAAEPRLRRALHRAISPAEPARERRNFSFFRLAPRVQWALAGCAACLVAGVCLITVEELRTPAAGSSGQPSVAQLSPEPAAHPSSSEGSGVAPPAGPSVPDTSLEAPPSSTAQADSGSAPAPPERVSKAEQMPDSKQVQVSSAPSAGGFMLAGGTPVRLEIASVSPGPESSWNVQGRLTPVAGPDGDAPFDGAMFSCVVRAGAIDTEISISAVSAGGHSNAINPAQPVRLTLELAPTDSRIHEGAVLEGKTSEDTTLRAAPQ